MVAQPKQSKGRNKGWDNLIPAKKGEVRNPHGRPKKELSISGVLHRILAEKDSSDGPTKMEQILRKVQEMAAEGDMAAIHFLADRTEGKALQAIWQRVTQDVAPNFQGKKDEATDTGGGNNEGNGDG
jgi:hypothetical protein